MNARDEIIKRVNEQKLVPAKLNERSHLFMELGFDSLGFVQLLSSIEEALSISFMLTEMEQCLYLDRLIAIVEAKLKGAGA